MALPEVVSREQWLVARRRLLEQEKDLTRQVTLDKPAGQLTYNYRPEPGALGDAPSTELPGASCFLRDGGEVFHTYSAFARGLDHIDMPYAFLDMTVLGRQES